MVQVAPVRKQACPACGAQTYVDGSAETEVVRVDARPLRGSEDLLAMLEGRYTVRLAAGRLRKRSEPRGPQGRPCGYTSDGQQTTAYAAPAPPGVLYAQHLCDRRPVDANAILWSGVASW